MIKQNFVEYRDDVYVGKPEHCEYCGKEYSSLLLFNYDNTNIMMCEDCRRKVAERQGKEYLYKEMPKVLVFTLPQ